MRASIKWRYLSHILVLGLLAGLLSFGSTVTASAATRSYNDLPLACGTTVSSAGTYDQFTTPEGVVIRHGEAIDLPAPAGTEVVAPEAGRITTVAWDGDGYGNYVMLLGESGVTHLFAHLQGARIISQGTNVDKSSVLGLVGSTGQSSGPHLHYEQRRGNSMVTVQLDGPSLQWGPRVDSIGSRSTTHGLTSSNCSSQSSSVFGHDEVKIHLEGTGSTYRLNANGSAFSMYNIAPGYHRVECDTDGDGVDELFTATKPGNRWIVKQGVQVAGSDNLWSVYSRDFDGREINSMSCGDRDGNGRDEVKVHLSGGQIRRIAPDGDTFVVFSNRAPAHFLVECDTNGDGLDEIFSAEYRNNQWFVMQGQRPNVSTKSWIEYSRDFDRLNINAMSCGDRNGNGRDEVKVHLIGGDIRRVSLSDHQTYLMFSGKARPVFMVECDVNADGIDELFSVEHRGNRWYVMQGTFGARGEDKSWSELTARGREIKALSCGDRDGW